MQKESRPVKVMLHYFIKFAYRRLSVLLFIGVVAERAKTIAPSVGAEYESRRLQLFLCVKKNITCSV